MKTVSTLAMTTLACLMLAGCGGGGGGGSSADSFASLVDENRRFFVKYNSDGTLENDITPAASMPKTGTATYRGAAMIWAGEDISGELENPDMADVDAAGRMRMQADMSAGTVTGTIGEFRKGPGDKTLGGTMDFDGTIRDNRFRAASSGNLTVDGATQSSNGVLIGAFIGRGASDMTGFGSGNIGPENEYFLIFSGQKRP